MKSEQQKKIETQLRKKIIIEKNSSLKLEQNSLLRKTSNLVIIPILNLLPIKSRKLIKKSNAAVNEVIDNATTHKALEVLYHKGAKHGVKKIYEKIAHLVWFNTNNSKAVRNRLKIVINEMRKALLVLKETHEEINIVSIAAGSSRAILQSLEDNKILDKKIHVTFVDKNPLALEYSKELLKDFSISNTSNYSFEWINNTVNGFLDTTDRKYSIVEMVGLMDYFDDDRARAIFEKINSILQKDGHFITANINYNSEKPFVTKAIGWPMVYRSAEHLARLVGEAGFPHASMDIYYEPLQIHSIIIAKKIS